MITTLFSNSPRAEGSGQLMQGTVVANETLCRDHFRLVLALPPLESARPGQFLHLGQPSSSWGLYSRPFLRRAFSIAGLRARGSQCEVDVIYRLHGAGTCWMASLRTGDLVNVLGPLGRSFGIHPSKPTAWLLAGGVGLPPILWLAEWLEHAGKETVAFYGARTYDCVPLMLRDPQAFPRDAAQAVMGAEEFTRCNTPVVLSTDDGSLGFHGSVAEALAAYRRAWGGADGDVVAYCCGPEGMMAAVATWCLARGIECYACLEREMACGMGTCQSCVVRVHDATDAEGWRYALCCSEGAVFNARDVIWT
ncbi:MAG: dihydroorotate dehydrogenase electron transfer subunit [Planctomycetota bacterium]